MLIDFSKSKFAVVASKKLREIVVFEGYLFKDLDEQDRLFWVSVWIMAHC